MYSLACIYKCQYAVSELVYLKACWRFVAGAFEDELLTLESVMLELVVLLTIVDCFLLVGCMSVHVTNIIFMLTI